MENVNKYIMNDTQKIVVWFLGFILILLCTFRPLHSSDTYGYYMLYLDAISNGNPFVEPLYQIISNIGEMIFGIEGGFRFLLFFYSICAMYIMTRVLDYCEDKFLSYLTWFSFAYAMQLLIQMRSAVANILFIWSLQDIVRGEWKNYYLKIIIAIAFHNQAVVFLLIYPLARVVLKYRKILVILPILMVGFSKYAVNYMGDLFSIIAFSGDEYLATKTYVYTAVSYTDIMTNPLNRISLVLILVFIFELVFVGMKKLQKDEIVYLTIASISLFCYFLGYYTVPIIAMRYPECFNLVLIMLLPIVGIRHIKGYRYYSILVLIYLGIICDQYDTFPMIIDNIMDM